MMLTVIFDVKSHQTHRLTFGARDSAKDDLSNSLQIERNSLLHEVIFPESQVLQPIEPLDGLAASTIVISDVLLQDGLTDRR